MNLAEFSIKNKLISVLVILLSLLGGWSAYQTMPRFEDPEFTIRNALIFTAYPGASPQKVAQEVTEPLERALQELQEVKKITSTSSAGMSEINVEIKYKFSKNKEALTSVWAKMRNKIKDAQSSLPKGTGTSLVKDDFGDLYGWSYFITGEDYTPAELYSYAKTLQKEILQVSNVGKVQLAGAQKEQIFIEISREKLQALGGSVSKLYDILNQQNAVVSSGHVTIGDQRLIIDPSGSIDTVQSIKNLLVSTSSDGKITYLGDIAKIYRGYQKPSEQIVRYEGKFAIALGVSSISGSNVVEIGKAIDKKIIDGANTRPLGMKVSTYYNQGNIVEASVQDFVVNVIAALVIVIITLILFMGWRSAAVIGAVLLLTISATLLGMKLMEIPMHRISLGALIIALGMMVDNAIVVAEGILVGVQRGIKKMEISKKIVSQSQWPLLAGTLVGITAFAPIGFAPGSTAEYTGTLFWVVMLSLLFSWIFAVTTTPLLCYWWFPEPGDDFETKPEGTFSRYYKKMMRGALHIRWLLISLAAGLMILSFWGAQFMAQGFFPKSTTPQLVVDYWLPEGTAIERTTQDMIEIEAYINEMDNVSEVQTLIGQGGIRYMLVYAPESPNSSYGQLLVKVEDYKKVDAMLPKIQEYIKAKFPDADAKAWRFVLGPGGGSQIEAEFRGPDPKVLRQLANNATDIMRSEQTLSVKHDWREQVAVIEPIYSETKGRRAGVSREDLALALQQHYDGKQVGTYREADTLIPIIARDPNSKNATINDVESLQVLSSGTGKMVPISQVTDGFRTIWRDGRLRTENRMYTIKAQCDPYPEELAATLLNRLRPKIESMQLPNGYSLEWGGIDKKSKESNEDLMSTIPMGFLAMVLIVMVLFGKLKQTIVIWLLVPGLFIGVVFGLVVTGIPLEFMGILGILSLSGLLIKNAIVLVDQMDIEINAGKARFDAVVDAASSRVRPVMIGTLTTVLGVIPLFYDAFFQSMAVVIVFGLTFATILTLIVEPLLYSVIFNIKPEETNNRGDNL